MKRNNKIKVISLMIICVAILISLIQVVSAYALMTNGYYKKNIPINTVSYVDSTYTSAVNAAISSWNNAGTPVSITSGSAPYVNSVMTLREVYDTWYGRYEIVTRNTSAYPLHATTSFYLLIDMDNSDRLSSTAKQSVVAHEFGHAFGLDDLYNAGDTALMSTVRNRDTIYKPQGDDKLGVSKSWP